MVSDLLLAAILYRAVRGRFLKVYGCFYLYLAAVLSADLIRAYLAAVRTSAAYALGYWISELALAVVGFGVTWEVYRHAMNAFDGARRMARAVFTALLLTVIVRAVFQLKDGLGALGRTTLELERNLQVLQAVLLIALVSLIAHYQLALSRNLRFLLSGYGLYLVGSIISRTLRLESDQSHAAWWALPSQFEYCATLVIWFAGFWSCTPDPVPELDMERDYEWVANQTMKAFGRLRHHVVQSWRSS